MRWIHDDRDIDVAAFLPHSPLRVYVMGRRGVDREPANAEDLALMRKLAAEAIEVGALGFASSRLTLHKCESGQPIPSFEAGQAEIEAIARGVKDAGGGLIQFVPDLVAGDYGPALQMVFDVADDVGLPVTFTLAIGNAGDPFFVDGLNMVEKANAAGGDITAQIFPRPIGLVMGLELSGNPFVMFPSYREIADLPLAERVAEMRKPEVRERILAEHPSGEGHPLMFVAQAFEWMFPLGDPPNYEPPRSESIASRAKARGVSPREEAYDRLLDDDGHAMLLITLANFRDGSLDTVAELFRRDDVVLGLGDGGAHYGMICDASFPTYMLAYWARDRATGRLSVADAIRELTSAPARVAGLADRGRIAVGYKADLNVIDHSGADAAQACHRPRPARGWPASGPDRRRLRRDDRVRRGHR